jgi:hypothetical protein
MKLVDDLANLLFLGLIQIFDAEATGPQKLENFFFLK